MRLCLNPRPLERECRLCPVTPFNRSTPLYTHGFGPHWLNSVDLCWGHFVTAMIWSKCVFSVSFLETSLRLTPFGSHICAELTNTHTNTPGQTPECQPKAICIGTGVCQTHLTPRAHCTDGSWVCMCVKRNPALELSTISPTLSFITTGGAEWPLF